ncbi:MAG: cadherin domain-containing protein [Ekhidna sp.]|nr:cadherin domain-containing protein [Ekhidna sp.]
MKQILFFVLACGLVCFLAGCKKSAPVIADQTFSIAEDAEIGTAVGTVIATDADKDNMTFSISSGNTDDAFRINARDGNLITAGTLDFETKASYTLVVSVSDDKISATATITVNVMDVDETNEEATAPVASVNTAPMISNQAFSIAEDVVTGTAFGSVVATDADGDALTFSITGGNTDGDLRINARSGELITAKALDFETTESYMLMVSVSDGALSATATITVNVTDVDVPGERLPAKDINTLKAVGNEGPSGIWSDGITLWVVDFADVKIYAYRLAGGTRQASKDINTLRNAGNNNPTGIWSGGYRIRVADWQRDKTYSYRLSGGARQKDNDINRLKTAGNTRAQGIWADETTLWVADADNDKIYAYRRSDGVRKLAKEINTLKAAGNNSPYGIWSDGTTIWVTDTADDKIYAYNLADGARLPGKDINTLQAAGNNLPTGIWSDGITLWVADRDDAKIYAYRLTEP